MAETTGDTEKNSSDHGNLKSESEGAHVPTTSPNINNVNTTGPIKLAPVSCPPGELEEPVSGNTPSASNEHAGTDGVEAFFQSDGSGNVTDSNTRTADVSSPSDPKTPGRLEGSNVSSNRNESSKTNDSNRYSDSDEPERANNPDISYSRKETDLLQPLLVNATNKTLIDRLLGCAYGQALGDAYGLSTEFETRREVAYNYPDPSELIPFPDYVLTRHSQRWTRGDWTDDTDQWILILDTLMDENGDEKMFAKKLTNWIRRGYPELGDYGGLGLGANVSQVVHSHGYVNDPLKASEAVWKRSGQQAAPNGAVMRCSASAFVHYNDIEKVKSTAILMCKTTHFDPRCLASCLSVCLAIAYLLRGEADDNNIELLIKRVQDETIAILGDSFPQDQRDLFLWHTAQERTLEDLDLDESRSIGFTYKCLGSGFYGLRSTDSFEQTLNDLIRYGGDADTNGAVCGTMYGARHGYKKLPQKWLRAMPFKKWFDQKIIECFEKMNLIGTQPMDTNE